MFDDYLELPIASYNSIYFSTLNIELPRWLGSKESACNAGDAGNTGSIPGSRCPGGGHGNSLLYSCLKNLMDRGAWWATVYRVSKSQTWLKQLSKQAHWTCHSMRAVLFQKHNYLATENKLKLNIKNSYFKDPCFYFVLILIPNHCNLSYNTVSTLSLFPCPLQSMTPRPQVLWLQSMHSWPSVSSYSTSTESTKSQEKH